MANNFLSDSKARILQSPPFPRASLSCLCAHNKIQNKKPPYQLRYGGEIPADPKGNSLFRLVTVLQTCSQTLPEARSGVFLPDPIPPLRVAFRAPFVAYSMWNCRIAGIPSRHWQTAPGVTPSCCAALVRVPKCLISCLYVMARIVS